MTQATLTPEAIIGKTLERLGENGEHWSPSGPGIGSAERGGYECVAVALGRAARRLGYDGRDGQREVWEAAEQCVLAEFFLLNVPSLRCASRQTIGAYNDHPDTRWPAVKQVLTNAQHTAATRESFES